MRSGLCLMADGCRFGAAIAQTQREVRQETMWRSTQAAWKSQCATPGPALRRTICRTFLRQDSAPGRAVPVLDLPSAIAFSNSTGDRLRPKAIPDVAPPSACASPAVQGLGREVCPLNDSPTYPPKYPPKCPKNIERRI